MTVAAPRVLSMAVLAILVSGASLFAQPRVNELNDAGWKAIKNGDGPRAAAYFAEALSARPDDAVLLLGAGTAAHAQGKTPQAMKQLTRALEVDPTLIYASKLLGQIAYSEGNVDLAIRTYEKALVHAPRDEHLASDLANWRVEAEAHRGFDERRYDRFNVLYQGHQDESVAAVATNVLNAAFWRVGQKLGAYPTDPVVVVLYTEKQFRDITRAPEWSGGIYDGRIRIPVAGATREPERFTQVLTHELVHAMITSLAPHGVPAWLHEGVAQMFDGEDVAAARRRLKAGRKPVSLKALEQGFTRLDSAQARVAYDQSLVAASVLFERPDFGWSRLLADLANGEPFERAIARFGYSYADLEAAMATP